VKKTYDYPEDVLQFAIDQTDAALLVLTTASGGTLRAPGAIMAVTRTSHVGYISNGCVDADLILRARAGETGVFVYGESSPYRDIILPCSGRLEIQIYQDFKRDAVQMALSRLQAGEPTELVMDEEVISFLPRLKLRIAGKGAACIALSDLATAAGIKVHLQSPEAAISHNAEHLRDPNIPPHVTDDPRTAMVCLFHEHDWETALLKQAIDGPCFYVGAMGSVRTHENRCKILREIGASQKQIDMIKGPIGLIPAQRNARFLAVSILAEIIQVAQAKNLI